MIKRLSHASIYVDDQTAALEFYTEKLGFEVRMDVKMDSFRWLTVGVRGQDLELVLMGLTPGGMYDEETVAQIRSLVRKGALGVGVFHTDDCRRTYAELSARGVEFRGEPQEQPYGIEAMFRDNSGNWFSLTQPR